MDKNEISVSLLNHYHTEWMHRHSHYWKILSSVFITNLVIICFPICCTYFNIELSPTQVSPKIFPVIGILFTAICTILLLIECKKIINLRKNINIQLDSLQASNKKIIKKTAFSKITKYINYIIALLLSFSMILVSLYVFHIL